MSQKILKGHIILVKLFLRSAFKCFGKPSLCHGPVSFVSLYVIFYFKYSCFASEANQCLFALLLVGTLQPLDCYFNHYQSKLGHKTDTWSVGEGFRFNADFNLFWSWFVCVIIALLWKSGAILDLPCPSVILKFCFSVIPWLPHFVEYFKCLWSYFHETYTTCGPWWTGGVVVE